MLCLIPFLRWISLSPLNEQFATWDQALLSLGKALGIVGLVLYALNFVLSTRWKRLEDLFGGLNRVYIAHHIIGGAALICVLFHPILLALNLVDFRELSTFHNAALFLLPRGIHIDGYLTTYKQLSAINNGIVAYLGMVILLIITFFVKLPYQIWRLTHKFLGVAFLLAGLHVLLIRSDTSRDVFLKFYLLMWVVVGLACFAYRSLMANVVVRRSKYRVEKVVSQPGNVIALELSPVERSISFKAGQFVFIRFPDSRSLGISKESHPFSITSSPSGVNLWLGIKALGDYTKSLTNLKPGTVAEIEGAFGRFISVRSKRPQIWIAGGIGITPFLSMVQALDPTSPAVTLVYSAATRSELLEQEALGKLIPNRLKNFTYHAYVTDEQKGFLTADWVEQQYGKLDDVELYICGPPSMMKSLKQQFISKGVRKHHIRTEEFALT